MTLTLDSLRLAGGLRTIILVCVLPITCFHLSCSIPNLENQECSEAADTVKEFYSWYLGTDAAKRAEQQQVFRRFIAESFRQDSSSGLDPFFLSATTPTTFKIGKCEISGASKTSIQVQLYWRENSNVDQKEVYAEAVKNGDKWLIDNVVGR